MGAPLPRWAPPWPGKPPAPSDDCEGMHSSETEGVLPRYVYIHTPLPSAQFFNLDTYDKDRMCNTDFISALLPNEGPSTG